MNLPLLSLALLAFILAYYALLIVYRLFFHPLARFPGPKLAAATGLYEAYYDMCVPPGGQFAYKLRELHSKYGPIIRINPHEIHVHDSSWINTIYVGPQHTRNKYPPAAFMLGTPQACFGTLSHTAHRRRRVPVAAFYSKTAVEKQHGIIYEQADKFSQTVHRHITQHGHAEMRKTFLAFSTDTLIAYTFDGAVYWNLLENDNDAKTWFDTIRAVASYTQYIRQFPWLITLAVNLPLSIFDRLLPELAKILRIHKDMNKYASQIVKPSSNEKTAQDPESNEGRPGLFPSIVAHKGLHASDKEPARIAQEGVEVIAAGVETVSRVLTSSLYYILAHKEAVLPRLRDELLSVMPQSGSRPHLKELESLPWLTALIKESLRIAALTTSRLPLICPDEDLPYGEWRIPRGTPVGVTLRDILMDPNIFEKPDDFLPERWLSSNPDLDKISQYLVPFSRGSRMCLGQHFAMAEIYICLATLFRRYDLDLYDTDFKRDMEIVKDFFVGEVSDETKGVRIAFSQTD